MSSRQKIQELIEKITEKAEVKKTFLKDLKPIPLKSCLIILEDFERLLEDRLPAGQTKPLIGYSLRPESTGSYSAEDHGKSFCFP